MKHLFNTALTLAAISAQALFAYAYTTPDGTVIYTDTDNGKYPLTVETDSDWPGYYFYGPYYWEPNQTGRPHYYDEWRDNRPYPRNHGNYDWNQANVNNRR